MLKPPLYGLVLIGGNSTRMGKDKSLLKYHQEDQRDHTYKLLTEHCEKVFMSCNKAQAEHISLPHLPDSDFCAGPMNGLLTAQNNYPDVAWLLLACDMPKVDHKLLNLLLENRDTEAIATCFIHDIPEPLCTIWEPSSHQILIEMASQNIISPKRILQNHLSRVNQIAVTEVMQQKLININTPNERF